MKPQPVILAVTSDQHVSSTVGLCPPEGVRFDDGGRYDPSKPQLWLWECWTDYWQTVESLRRELKARLFCVYNGDATDGGAHHGTTATISNDPEVQSYLTTATFQVPRKLKADKSYMVRGTAVHVGGDSAPNETALAKHLNCERDPETDSWASWHIRLPIHGRIFDFQHHGRVGTRPHTKQNALSALACQIWMEHSLKGLRHPDVAFRSHRHTFGDSENAYPTRLIQTPSFQLKTAFAHRVVPESIADVGGVICVIEPDGQYRVIPKLYPVALPKLRTVS